MSPHDDATELLDIMIQRAGGPYDATADARYIELRRRFRSVPQLSASLPGVVSKCRNLKYLWDEVKSYPTYSDRRTYLRNAFAPFFDSLETLPDEAVVGLPEHVRRDIFDELHVLSTPWWGRLDEPTFLARLFDLEKLPSTDHRYENALGDIYQHRVYNED